MDNLSIKSSMYDIWSKKQLKIEDFLDQMSYPTLNQY